MRGGRPTSFFDLMVDPFEARDLVERDLEPMQELVPILQAWWEG